KSTSRNIVRFASHPASVTPCAKFATRSQQSVVKSLGPGRAWAVDLSSAQLPPCTRQGSRRSLHRSRGFLIGPPGLELMLTVTLSSAGVQGCAPGLNPFTVSNGAGDEYASASSPGL